jgi:hypothetical protein
VAASSKLVLAIEMAKRMHINDSKALEHSLRVMDAAETIEKKIVGVLHETNISITTLRRIFDDEVSEAIEAFRNNTMLQNGLAHSVMLLDLADSED